LTEQGVTGFEEGPWYALLGPARMPKLVVALLNSEVVKIVNTADVKQKLATVGAEPVGSTPEQCAQVIRNELAKWTKLIKETGIRLE
jgi:tripartite-type tricarboxylate transporter receptor subunit TctC